MFVGEVRGSGQLRQGLNVLSPSPYISPRRGELTFCVAYYNHLTSTRLAATVCCGYNHLTFDRVGSNGVILLQPLNFDEVNLKRTHH